MRVADELRCADVILAEDTRRTSVLLRHLGVGTPMLSFHEHNEARRLPEVVARLQAGERLALVSDAGTPGLADPGYRLVRAAIDVGAAVTALPGPSALLAAVVLSGLPLHRFAFLGFVPRGAEARRAALTEALELPMTAVWYESPRRLAATLSAARDLGHGGRPAAVARELTKLHEEVVRATVGDLADRYAAETPRGEIVLMIGPASAPKATEEVWEAALDEVAARRRAGESLTRAVSAVSGLRGVDRRALYAAVVGGGGRGEPRPAAPPARG
jgi:16S rRNA (cytidine1402-2'-O)-methyltransferase